jgi:hypothetical protein
MSAREDLTGQKFGRLTVTNCEQRINGKTKHLCKCDCGNEVYVEKRSLKGGNTSSCGCLHRELLAESNKRLKTKHGMTDTRLYRTWDGIKKRCYNTNDKDFCRYGARGISMCDEWRNDFRAFYDWAINNGYAADLTIDRKDNNGHYEPLNCKWSTTKEQNNNRRTNHLITYNGETKNIKQWADQYGINRVTLSKRINRFGWPIEKALGLA